ncbi:MAG TPA: serine/threonine-protein kinase [Polyangiaceae bacterium]|nr:serine/threonine-protein kinase [Polyangiaceae bacterium]
MHPLVGSTLLSKYRLVEHIGGGGMGHVFRAERISDGARVAVKLVHRDLAASEDVTKRLFQEAVVLRELDHPNVVRLLDADLTSDGPCIVMEFLEGQTAGTLLTHLGRLDEPAVIALAIPILGALAATHRAGVIHRDLKPDNIFIARTTNAAGATSATVKLLDFGVAKVDRRVEGGPRTNTGIVFGTPDYLSPEQATGELPLDGRSDLFSLGVVMFELLAGRRPFTAGTAVATAFRIVHASPPSFESLGVTVSRGLAAALKKLLAKSRDNRPPNAEEAAKLFVALAPDEGARARRLLRFVDEPDERRRRTTRPPPSPRSFRTQAGIALDIPEPRPSRPGAGLAPKAAGRAVRGPLLRSLDAAIEAKYGEGGRERVVALMPDDHASELRRGRPSALEAHDVDAVKLYADIASRILHIDLPAFHELGRFAVTDELASIVGTLMRPAPLPDAARRSIALLCHLFEFGTWSVARADLESASLRAEGAELLPSTLRAFFAGVVERVFENAVGKPVRVRDTSPSTRASLFELEATVRP